MWLLSKADFTCLSLRLVNGNGSLSLLIHHQQCRREPRVGADLLSNEMGLLLCFLMDKPPAAKQVVHSAQPQPQTPWYQLPSPWLKYLQDEAEVQWQEVMGCQHEAAASVWYKLLLWPSGAADERWLEIFTVLGSLKYKYIPHLCLEQKPAYLFFSKPSNIKYLLPLL